MERFTADQAGERLDIFLTRQTLGYTRSHIQKLCQLNVITVNGQPAKANTKLKAGDEVRLQNNTQPAQPVELPVLYEDNDVIVINKPTGILTHAKGALNDEFTVAEFMRSRTTDNPEGNRPGIVHRLDRGTSGVLIGAKNNEAKRWLQKQFSERKAKKTYIALVVGAPENDEALIQLPIERNPKKPQTFRVGASGKPAETHYEVMQKFQGYTLLRLKPTTGRTHQLRVHLHYLHCPIVGDEFYGTPEPRLGRLFLHAASLEITLPSRERRTFEAPLAPDLQNFLDSLEQ